MIDKLEVYNKINSKSYLRFELNESNEKEYLNKLISVRDALNEVEKKNNEAYDNKINRIEGIKEEIKDFYNYSDEANLAYLDLDNDFNSYVENYIKPLEQLFVRKEKLQVQVVPYITNGFWQKFKAYFSYEGRAKLTIERQFNKELKSVDKEIKELESIKTKNPLNFSNREDEVYKNILENIDLNMVNDNSILSTEQISEFKASLKVAKNITIKNSRMNILKGISEYVEVCSDYLQIADLNIEEHYKFKNTEYKIYLQNGYLDNDINSISKYLEVIKSENDFVGKQAASKLTNGIQECIDELEKIINEDNNEDLKLA